MCGGGGGGGGRRVFVCVCEGGGGQVCQLQIQHYLTIIKMVDAFYFSEKIRIDISFA